MNILEHLIPVLSLLRILSYLSICLLVGLILPTYHTRFSWVWRSLGIYFGCLTASVVIRLLLGPVRQAFFNDWVLTPVVSLVVMALVASLLIQDRKRA